MRKFFFLLLFVAGCLIVVLIGAVGWGLISNSDRRDSEGQVGYREKCKHPGNIAIVEALKPGETWKEVRLLLAARHIEFRAYDGSENPIAEPTSGAPSKVFIKSSKRMSWLRTDDELLRLDFDRIQEFSGYGCLHEYGGL